MTRSSIRSGRMRAKRVIIAASLPTVYRVRGLRTVIALAITLAAASAGRPDPDVVCDVVCAVAACTSAL